MDPRQVGGLLGDSESRGGVDLRQVGGLLGDSESRGGADLRQVGRLLGWVFFIPSRHFKAPV